MNSGRPDDADSLAAAALGRIGEPILALDTTLEVVYANDEFTREFEHDGTVVGLPIEEVLPEGDHARSVTDDAIETGSVRTFTQYTRGRTRWFEGHVYPDADGASVVFTETAGWTDEERYLERIVENLPVAVGLTSVGSDGTFTYVNESMVEMFDAASKQELKRHPVSDIYVDPTDRDRLDADLRQTGRIEERELALETLSGDRLWGAVTATRETIGGEPHILKTIQDVTARRERAKELEWKTRAMDEAPVGITIADPSQPDDPMIYVNDRFVEMTGYSESEALGRNCRFLQGPGTDQEPVAAMREAVDEREPVTVTLRNYRADGTEFWNQVTIAPVRDDAGCVTHFVGFQQDVTDRMEYERELERYKELVGNVPVGIYRNTPGSDGEFIEVNPAMVTMFDADSEADLLEHSVSDLYVDPDERAAFSDSLSETGLVVEEEIRLQTLSGSTFWGSVTALATETAAGTFFDGVVQDITARKEYAERLEEQRDDLELLNQMVRHDIRNDLQLVMTHLELLADHVEGEPAEFVETALESTHSAIDLTRTARDVAAVLLQNDADGETLALAPSIERQVEDTRTAYPNADITVEGSLPQTNVVATEMLDSVIRNLLSNAVQHNDKAVPAVTVSVTEHDAAVTVRVADNGPGIPDDRKAEIFGRGEKGLESDGTGIGLYLVNTLVEDYGGEVHVEDRTDGPGAVFVIRLRKAEAA